MIDDVLEDIIDDKRDLTEEEAYKCMDDLISGDYPDVKVAAFLIALRMKGETIDEITGLTKSMKDHAVQIDYDPDEYLIETCGTGGDTFKTFNVSTASSIIASAGGAKISKHGNRSVSSKFGGADALEALGINIKLSPEQVINSIEKCNFAFIFAPIYHKATKNVMMIRKELKTRTVFNVLGPISCPSNVTARLTGVYDPDLVEPIARVASNLGVKRGMIVHGFDDEGNFIRASYVDNFDKSSENKSIRLYMDGTDISYLEVRAMQSPYKSSQAYNFAFRGIDLIAWPYPL